MAFAADTTITIPSGAMQIGQLRAADLILGAGLDLQWNQYELKFAESEIGRFTTAYIELDNGKAIVATPDQLFLLFTRELQPAESLRPGHELAGGGGQRVKVVSVSIGEYHGELCEIATSSTDPLNGHLFEAEGVVVADLDVQIGDRA